MIPLRTELQMFEMGAGERERSSDQARRERLLRQHPPRPHLTPCACEECRRWALEVVMSLPPPGDGS